MVLKDEISNQMTALFDQLAIKVDITNREEDNNNLDARGEPTISETTNTDIDALVDVELAESLDRQRHGLEHRYDARIYLPIGTTIFESDSSHLPSFIKVQKTGVEYIVEKKDEQHGAIRCDCDRRR